MFCAGPNSSPLNECAIMIESRSPSVYPPPRSRSGPRARAASPGAEFPPAGPAVGAREHPAVPNPAATRSAAATHLRAAILFVEPAGSAPAGAGAEGRWPAGDGMSLRFLNTKSWVGRARGCAVRVRACVRACGPGACVLKA